MAAMKPQTNSGPVEVTREGAGFVLCLPLDAGGRIVVHLSPEEVRALSGALRTAAR